MWGYGVRVRPWPARPIHLCPHVELGLGFWGRVRVRVRVIGIGIRMRLGVGAGAGLRVPPCPPASSAWSIAPPPVAPPVRGAALVRDAMLVRDAAATAAMLGLGRRTCDGSAAHVEG